MIFLTVGTLFPFDRLTKAIDGLIGKEILQEEVFAQIGRRGYRPQHMKYAEVLDKNEFDQYFQQASGIISHAGMGTIIMALDYNKPLLVMARKKEYGEHVNDHQVHTAHKFAQLGHVLMADEPEQLAEQIPLFADFKSKPREAQPKVVAERIGKFLESLMASQE